MSKRWYVLHARSGYEAKVKTAIEEAIDREGLSDLLGDVMIPTEKVVELKDGQKKTAERKFFPGYMLINMELTESSWLLVKNTNNVIGFIGGSSGKPSPITQREVDKIMARVQEGADKPKPKVAYQPGEEILVIDGPFNEFNGTVESVDYEKNLLKVEGSIFLAIFLSLRVFPHFGYKRCVKSSPVKFKSSVLEKTLILLV
jgi:transcriptional antiterminator NusG